MNFVLAAPPQTLIPETSDEEYGDLAYKFQSGQFEIYDLPSYVIYLIEFLIYIGGGLAVLFIVIGGYKYIIGGVTDDKEAGKKTIGYAIAGFAIAVLSWTIVNFVQVWVTEGDGIEAPKKELWICDTLKKSEIWFCENAASQIWVCENSGGAEGT